MPVAATESVRAGRRQRFLRTVILLVVLTGPVRVSSEVAELPVDIASDASYLEYVLDTLQPVDWRGRRYNQQRPLRVMERGTSSEPVVIVVAYNSRFNEGTPAGFSFRRFPGDITIDDDAVDLVVNDWGFYASSTFGNSGIFGAGYRDFEAEAFTFIPEIEPGTPQNLSLCFGLDSSGDGEWHPRTSVLLIEDYDFDGILEAFVYVDGKDGRLPRHLFCVEVEPLRLQWSLPLASLARKQSFYSTRDSTNPAIVLATYNPRNGIRDSMFSDKYCSLVIIDTTGSVLLNRPLASNHGGVALVPSQDYRCFYLSHEDTSTLSRDDSASYVISIVTPGGKVVGTTSIDGKPSSLWLAELGTDPGPYLFAVTTAGVIHQFDTLLNLVGKSDPIRCGDHLGRIILEGQAIPAHVFAHGIYSSELRELARFSSGARWFEPMVLDDDSSVAMLAIGAENTYLIADVTRRSILARASIFFHRHQTALLSVLTGLVVALVSVNYYRARTKANLGLIARQKKELEEAHDALKAAQARIIEQEKYRQAQGIAGGFAHEIRNALLPSEGALLRIGDMDLADPGSPEKIDKYRSSIASAIDRALDLTDLISTYSRLDRELPVGECGIAEVLKDVVAANEESLNEGNVGVAIEVPDGLRVACSPQHLYVILNNLLLNSLDALAGKTNAQIRVEARPSNGEVRILHQDNGCGINDDQRERVFDMFFSTKPDTGKGIGLAMARKIAETCGGSITLRNDSDEPTTFEVRLPMVKSQRKR